MKFALKVFFGLLFGLFAIYWHFTFIVLPSRLFFSTIILRQLIECFLPKLCGRYSSIDFWRNICEAKILFCVKNNFGNNLCGFFYLFGF